MPVFDAIFSYVPLQQLFGDHDDADPITPSTERKPQSFEKKRSSNRDQFVEVYHKTTPKVLELEQSKELTPDTVQRDYQEAGDDEYSSKPNLIPLNQNTQQDQKGHERMMKELSVSPDESASDVVLDYENEGVEVLVSDGDKDLVDALRQSPPQVYQLGDKGIRVLAERLLQWHRVLMALGLENTVMSDNGDFWISPDGVQHSRMLHDGGRLLARNLLEFHAHAALATSGSEEKIIGDMCLRLLARELPQEKNLKDEMTVLCDQDAQSNTATEIPHHEIHDEGARTLADALRSNPSWTALDLSTSHIIGDKGAKAMAEALKQHEAMIELGLESNDIGDEGAIELAASLQYCPELKVLDLKHNRIGDAGAVALAKALRYTSNLTALFLENNQIGDKGAIALAQALQENSTLSILFLEKNKIGDDGARALAAALEQRTTVLTLLGLDGNRITFAGAMSIIKAMHQRTIASDCKAEIEHEVAEARKRKKMMIQWMRLQMTESRRECANPRSG